MELLTYKKFFEEDQAVGLTDLLKENGIEYSVLEDRESLDSLYGDKQFKRQYFVKIKKEDFKTVDDLLIRHSRQHLENVEKDHYLYTFTNEELYDILAKADEWNEFDFLLAQKILKERGEPVDEAKIETLKNERVRQLAKPDENQRAWIFAGYVLAFLGGLLGIFIGWHLSTFKKTLPNGERVYGYTVEDRSHGNRILLVGIVMGIVWLVVVVLRG